MPTTPDAYRATLRARVAQIDRIIEAQLNEILHDPAFQTLEGAWRGLQRFVEDVPRAANVRVLFLAASSSELLRDLEMAVEPQRSSIYALFKRGVKERGGLSDIGKSPSAQADRIPVTFLVADYAFGASPEDAAFMLRMGELATVLRLALLGAPAASLFDMKSFSDMPSRRDLRAGWPGLRRDAWHDFRVSDAARHLMLVLPRFLARRPYGVDRETDARSRNALAVDRFRFVEDRGARHAATHVWANAAYLLATQIVQTFTRKRVAIELPCYRYVTDEGDIALQAPVETSLTDRHVTALQSGGFVPLVHRKGTAQAAFFAAQTVSRAPLADMLALPVEPCASGPMPLTP